MQGLAADIGKIIPGPILPRPLTGTQICITNGTRRPFHAELSTIHLSSRKIRDRAVGDHVERSPPKLGAFGPTTHDVRPLHLPESTVLAQALLLVVCSTRAVLQHGVALIHIRECALTTK